MWLCLNNAFLSVVHKECAPDELLVRSRRPNDIRNVFPKANVRESFGTDYRYRAVVKRTEVAAKLSEIAMSYMASNFKGSVDDDRLHDAYNRVWGVMGNLQPGGPYARNYSRRDQYDFFGNDEEVGHQPYGRRRYAR